MFNYDDADDNADNDNKDNDAYKRQDFYYILFCELAARR